MSESKYKFSYFTIRGLGEGIRYIFAYAGIEYEDNRITQDEWPNVKSSYEFRMLPVLEFDGQQLNQSTSIARFLAKKYGLVHEDPLKDALLEALIDDLKEVTFKTVGAYPPRDSEGRKQLDDLLKNFMTKHENNVSEGFFYGSKPTWVDFYFTGVAETMETYIGPVLDPYPNLTALTVRVKGLEKIKKWIEVRPADVWSDRRA